MFLGGGAQIWIYWMEPVVLCGVSVYSSPEDLVSVPSDSAGLQHGLRLPVCDKSPSGARVAVDRS